jgi:hypothetical protein
MAYIKGEKLNFNETDLESLKNPFSKFDEIAKDIIKQQDHEMAMQFVKSIGKLLMENGVKPKITEYTQENNASNKFEMRYGCTIDGLDFTEHDKEFNDKIKHITEIAEQHQQQRKLLELQKHSLEKKATEIPNSPLELVVWIVGNSDFTVSELKEIAEYLNVFCRHNNNRDINTIEF